MKKLDNLEFLTGVITAGLLYLLTYLQYSKGKSYWFIIQISAILMTASAYVKYKKIKND